MLYQGIMLLIATICQVVGFQSVAVPVTRAVQERLAVPPPTAAPVQQTYGGGTVVG